MRSANRQFSISLLAAVSCLVFLVFAACAGCDDMDVGSATERVYITPSSCTLAMGEQMEFTASGGYEYTWSLENEEWGTLSTRTGNKTIYTSLYDPGTDNEVQILTVVSEISGVSGTNAAYRQEAEAYITHRSSQLTINAIEGIVFSDVGEYDFTASGGDEDETCEWSLTVSTYAHLKSTTGRTTTVVVDSQPGTTEGNKGLTLTVTSGENVATLSLTIVKAQ